VIPNIHLVLVAIPEVTIKAGTSAVRDKISVEVGDGVGWERGVIRY
jgi:hypothetical protein